jgi:hypothetical protein
MGWRLLVLYIVSGMRHMVLQYNHGLPCSLENGTVWSTLSCAMGSFLITQDEDGIIGAEVVGC